MTDNQRFTKCGLDPFGLLLVQGGGSGMPRDLPVGTPWIISNCSLHYKLLVAALNSVTDTKNK